MQSFLHTFNLRISHYLIVFNYFNVELMRVFFEASHCGCYIQINVLIDHLSSSLPISVMRSSSRIIYSSSHTIFIYTINKYNFI